MDAQTHYEKCAYFSGKRFVPLIFHLFSIEGGARHPWQLSAIATAITTWLGALSRSHGTRAHHKGGANSGEVQKTAQGERKGCTRTWKTNAPRAHRVVHRAHRACVSLLDWRRPQASGAAPTEDPRAGDHDGWMSDMAAERCAKNTENFYVQQGRRCSKWSQSCAHPPTLCGTYVPLGLQ